MSHLIEQTGKKSISNGFLADFRQYPFLKMGAQSAVNANLQKKGYRTYSRAQLSRIFNDKQELTGLNSPVRAAFEEYKQDMLALKGISAERSN